MEDKIRLLSLIPFKVAQYNQFALTTLTAYSIFWLHEWGMATTYENITVANHRMFPVKFCLVGWPEFPDANRTNRSILQMRPKYRNLASSASDQGVFLNQRGISEAKALTHRIGPPHFSGELAASTEIVLRAERGKRKRSVHPEDLLEKVRSSQLFTLFDKSRFDESEAIHLVGLLGVYDHTPSKEKKRKLKEFIDAARELGDKQAEEFLKLVSDRFRRYLDK